MPIPFSPFQFRLQIGLISLLLLAVPFGFVNAQQTGDKDTHKGHRHPKAQCLPKPNVIYVDTLNSNTASIYVCFGDTVKFDTTDPKAVFSLDFQKSIVDPPRLHFDERDRNVAFTVKKKSTSGKKEDHKFVLVLDGSASYYDPHVIIVPGSADQ
jgi:hypothetical protein